jgi:FMN phosphatase YigB (HAD superfamily)
MHKESTRCLLFDLGGTLWEHGDRTAAQAYERASNMYALAHLRRYTSIDVFAGMGELEAGEQLRKAVEKSIRIKTRENPLFEPDFIQTTAEALRGLGVPGADDRLGGAIYEALRVRSVDTRELFDDALSTLDALKRRGFVLGVVTNRHYGGKPFREDLCEMGLLDFFDYSHMAISADLGIRKPNPAIFTYALNELHVAPGEAAMIGDSLRADIAGAKTLNITAIWKPYRLHRHRNDADESGIEPDVRIERLRELLDIF